MALSFISKEKFNRVIELYFMWKELDGEIKKDYTRGINLPEAITEPICCYVNGFKHSTGEGKGSEDGFDPKTNSKIQIKGSSNFNSDLTSFGPESEFDELHFVRLNKKEDKMYLYKIPTDELSGLYVNKNQTFKDQQREGRRPRFSIIKQYIAPQEIEPYAIVDLKVKEII